MKYILTEYDPNLSASNLLQTPIDGADYLKWDSTNECDIILLRSRFGENVSESLLNICERMNVRFESGEETKKFVELGDFAVCIIPRIDNVGTMQRKYPIEQKGVRYSIFASRLQDENTRIIYKPLPVENPFNVVFRDVPLKFEVSMEEELIERKKGLFGGREMVSSGYFSMSFSKNRDIDGLKNGDLYYSINNVEIPLTVKIISAGKVVIKTTVRPDVKSKNSGIKVEIV